MSCVGHLSESDLLRGQVADLSRQLAERDRSMQDLREQSQLLRTIVEGTASETGDEFFASLVTHLTSTLHVQYAVISEVLEVPFRKIRTLAVSDGDALIDNFEYDLDHTPCATALTQPFACFKRDLQATFPEFHRLVDLGAESYCAVPVRTKGGAVSGLLVVMDTKPLQHGDDLQSLLEIFAPRVGAEFERKRVEQERARALAEIRNVIETVPDIMFTLDIHGNMVKWNRRVEDVTGHSPEELQNMPALAFVPPEEHIPTAAAIERAFMEGYAELEGHLLTKEHRLIPYHWTGALLKNSHGEPIGITGVGRDVSAKRRAEEERRKALTLLKNVINNTPDFIFVKDRDLRTVLCNNVFAQAIGKSPEDLIGRTDIENGWNPELVRGNPVKGIRGFEVDDREALSGRVVHNHADPVHVKGEIRIFDTYKIPLLSDTGEVTGVLGVARDITERKRAEEALREREEALARFKATLDQTHDCVFMFAPDTLRFIYCNLGAVEQVGYTEAELYMMTPLDIKPEFTEQSFRELLGSLREGRKSSHVFETVHRHKDGHNVSVEVFLQLVREQGGEGRFVAVVRDITERKRAEEASRVSEERFDLAVRGSNTGSWDWDLRTNKTYFSPLWKSMLGYEEHELRGEFSEWEERLHPDDRELALIAVQGYLKGDIPQYQLLHRLRHKDGSYRWILARGVSISDAGGKPYRMAGSHIDVTDQKQTQEALAQREHQLRTVLDALPVGVWFTDSTGKVCLANPAGCRIWAGVQHVGMESTDGHPGWWEHINSSGEPHRWALARALTKGEATINEELTIQGLDGMNRVIINSAMPLFGENGQVSGAIIVNQDITERKALERDRAQSQAFLQSVLENIPHIIIVTDAKTLKIVQMNRSAEQVLGLDRRALADKTLYEYLPEGEADVLWAADLAVLESRSLVEIPEHVVKRKGEPDRIFRTTTAPILDPESNPQYILAISEDITERTQAEAAVRQRTADIIRFQQARLRLMKVDHADQAAAWKTITETSGSVLGVGRVSIWLFNEDRSAIVCRDLYGLSTQSHEQGAELEARHYPKYFQTLASDVALATSDARTDPRTDEFTEHYLPLFGITSMMDVPIHLHGRVVGILCHEHTGPPREWTSEEEAFAASVADQVALSLEAEERVLAETALRSTKNQLQAILDHSPAVIFVKDTEGRYLLINRRYEELHHVSPNEVMGKTDLDIFDRDTADGLRSNDREVLHTGCPLSLEETVTVDDGILTVISTKFPLKDASGRPYAVCGIATDITERKHMEVTLRQREHDLRTAIEERERISQDLHDGILQALFAVGLTLETTKSMMSPRNRKTSGPPLDQAIDQLNRVMHEIRNFIAGLGSDLLQGKDLPTALQHMVESLTQNHATRVRLTIEDRAAQAVSAEQSLHLLFVIQEAMSNCIRHSRAQEARVSLKMLKQGIRLSIRDNGRGFNPDTAKGTGYGLSNMAARARKLRGRFTVLSKVNEGTRVVLDLPKEAAFVHR